MAYDNPIPFSFTNNGIYYFERRVPADLLKHYDTKKISYSLRTRSVSVAAARARRAADKLEDHWYYLRCREEELPGKHRLRMASGTTGEMPHTSVADMVTLSEAVAVYLKLKGRRRPITFHRAAERSCGYVIDAAGDEDLRTYTKSDANKFRDALIERGLAGSSITRIFGTVRAVTNFAASEMDVSFTNPFGGVYFDRQAGVQEREPLPFDAVWSVQHKCRQLDAELRWLVALVSDTGMRLAEAAGLTLDDLVIDEQHPKVIIREHPWRRLKTSGSAREVPLVGAALWAAKRIHGMASDQVHAFSPLQRYRTDKRELSQRGPEYVDEAIGSGKMQDAQLQAFDAGQTSRCRMPLRYRGSTRRMADGRHWPILRLWLPHGSADEVDGKDLCTVRRVKKCSILTVGPILCVHHAGVNEDAVAIGVCCGGEHT